MAILSGLEVQKQISEGRISIDPYKPEHVNPVSVDLTLGTEVKVYKPLWWEDSNVGVQVYSPYSITLDVKKENTTTAHMMTSAGLLLQPNVLYLMHTAERVCTDHYVPVLDGKSSLGRLGIAAHVTAGFGDPGFDGQYTLEVTTVHRVRIYPGMRFCQIRFHEIQGEVSLYQNKGHYTGEAAQGAVASKINEQFNER